MQIWHVSLLADAQQIAYYRTLLTPDERERADRYVFEKDQRRFAVGRAVLRILLGRALNQPPSLITLSLGEYGKPFVAGTTLQFNLANSEEVAAIAFVETHPVGIDIEYRRPIPSAISIAHNYFSADEERMFRLIADHPDATEAMIDEAFLHLWTRKEAWIKLHGEGLSRPLKSFTVSTDAPPRILHDDQLPDAAAQWQYHQLDLHPDYIATVVTSIHAKPPQITHYHHDSPSEG